MHEPVNKAFMKSVEHQYGLQMISDSHIGLFKCFHIGFWAFLTFKYRVKGDTSSYKLCVILK